jgi:hypothetical protein
MDNAVLDPEGYSPADVVARLQRTIRMGIEGINYTVVQREKNEKLFRDYCIDSRKRKDILVFNRSRDLCLRIQILMNSLKKFYAQNVWDYRNLRLNVKGKPGKLMG